MQNNTELLCLKCGGQAAIQTIEDAIPHNFGPGAATGYTCACTCCGHKIGTYPDKEIAHACWTHQQWSVPAVMDNKTWADLVSEHHDATTEISQAIGELQNNAYYAGMRAGYTLARRTSPPINCDQCVL